MRSEESLSMVRRYYESYRGENPAAVASALAAVLDPTFVLESPLVEAQFGGGDRREGYSRRGGAAPVLKNAEIEALYATSSGDGVAALIHFPSPVGVVVQSEHFDIDAATGKITRLRSYYDPRKLLPS